MKGMRSMSKMVTNPNGHTSNAVSSLFALVGIAFVIGLILSVIS